MVFGVLVFLTGSRRIMGDFTTSQAEKALLGVIMIFALYMSSLGIRCLVLDLEAL